MKRFSPVFVALVVAPLFFCWGCDAFTSLPRVFPAKRTWDRTKISFLSSRTPFSLLFTERHTQRRGDVVPHTRNTQTRITMLRREYDLVVIGAGPTGLTAALSAASAGRSALIIDATPKRQVQFTGPTGLFSKALRDTSKKVDVGVLRNMGMRDTAVWRQVQEMTEDVLRQSGLSNLKAIQLSSIPHLRGAASFVDGDPHKINVNFLETSRTVEVQGKNVLIATGSRPYRLKHIPYDGHCIFDSDTIKQLSFLPKTITIVGAGIIAIEYAKIFSKLDCKVTIIVRGKSLASALVRIGIDDQIALELQRDLCLNKVRIVFEAEIDEVIKPDAKSISEGKPLVITLKDAKTGEKHRNGAIRSHVLLTATGRQANTDKLNLQGVGVELDKAGNVLVDGQLHTSVKTIYAAGDVLGAPALASTGIEQALAAVRTMFKLDTAVENAWRNQESKSYDPRSLISDPLKYPIGIWTLPEIAFIGPTRKRAVLDKLGGVDGTAVGSAVAFYQDTIRGRVQDLNIGFLKLVYAKPSGKILGVHILGEDACELIHYGTALAQSGKTVYAVLGTMFAAVTFHELFKIAALKAVMELDRDKWKSILHKIGVDSQGMMAVDSIKPGLLAAGLNFEDVNDICNALKGSQMILRDQVLNQCAKLRPPRD